MPLMEFALSPSSLSISANIDIIEGDSSSGYSGVAAGNTPTPGLSNQLIQSDQSFSINVKWTEHGIFVPFLSGGTWKIDVLFEQMGGAEVPFNPSANAMSTGKPGNSYATTVNVPAGTLKPGIYRIIFRMQWHFAAGKPGPIVMFKDLGLTQIYQEL
ncbi:MAG: hypothetical protein HC912_08765 [Saprospiraceae bacterium]|nr:hypothetical protein [Saprospiraceae bacterium]